MNSLILLAHHDHDHSDEDDTWGFSTGLLIARALTVAANLGLPYVPLDAEELLLFLKEHDPDIALTRTIVNPSHWTKTRQ